MSERIEDRLPDDVADRKVFWVGSLLLARAIEQGSATAQFDQLEVEVEIARMEEPK